jgi:sec-independent protein translocase protein TatB
MFDIGGWEFMFIIILGIVIIGPKELPGLLRNITIWIRKARGLAREFQSGIDDIVQEAEFEKIRQDVMDGADPTGTIGDIKDDINQALDPEGEIKETFSMDDTDNWFSDHDEQDDDPDEEENSIGLPNPDLPEPPTSDDPSSDDPSSDDKDKA